MLKQQTPAGAGEWEEKAEIGGVLYVFARPYHLTLFACAVFLDFPLAGLLLVSSELPSNITNFSS